MIHGHMVMCWLETPDLVNRRFVSPPSCVHLDGTSCVCYFFVLEGYGSRHVAPEFHGPWCRARGGIHLLASMLDNTRGEVSKSENSIVC
jgi:hypothetical protein